MASENPPSRSTGTPDSNGGDPSDVSPVLLLDEGNDADKAETCRGLLDHSNDGPRQVVMLSLTANADACIDRLVDPPGLQRLHVITTRRGATSTTVALDGPDDRTEIVTDHVSDPSDLPRLGMAASGAVDDCDPAGRIRICVDSLTAMLQYADRGRVFRFVQVLQDRLNQSSAVAHYHLTPAAHDERTVETLRQLFDEVVNVGREDHSPLDSP